MLVIRMQRTGRKGHAMFRVVIQDSRRTPTSGKVVAQVGSYDPHSKTVSINKEKAQFYLEHGAQPSDRVVRLFTLEGIKLPAWVTVTESKSGATRNADKRRSTRPAEEKPAEAPAEKSAVEAEAPAEEAASEEVSAEETPAEAPTEPEAPATEPAEIAEAPEAEKPAE